MRVDTSKVLLPTINYTHSQNPDMVRRWARGLFDLGHHSRSRGVCSLPVWK